MGNSDSDRGSPKLEDLCTGEARVDKNGRLAWEMSPKRDEGLQRFFHSGPVSSASFSNSGLRAAGSVVMCDPLKTGRQPGSAGIQKCKVPPGTQTLLIEGSPNRSWSALNLPAEFIIFSIRFVPKGTG